MFFFWETWVNSCFLCDVYVFKSHEAFERCFLWKIGEARLSRKCKLFYSD